MEPERVRLLRGVGARGDERVAGGRAHPFAHAVGEAHREHVPGQRREGDQGPRGVGHAVAQEHQGLAPREAVGERTGEILHEGRGALGHALHQPHPVTRRVQGDGEKEGEEGGHHVGRNVGEKAHHAQHDHIARQGLCFDGGGIGALSIARRAAVDERLGRCYARRLREEPTSCALLALFVPTLVLLGCTPTAGIGGNAFLDVVSGDQVAVDTSAPADATRDDRVAPPE